MNELQQVLLVFAVIVVVGLYFFSRQRNQRNRSEDREQPVAKQSPTDKLKQKFSHGFTASSESSSESSPEKHPAMAGKTQEELDFESRQALLKFEEPLPEVYPFDPPPQNTSPNEKTKSVEAVADTIPKHKVIEVDDLEWVEDRYPSSYKAPTHTHTEHHVINSKISQQEPEIYAILVLFTQVDLSVNKLMKHLQGVGLVYDERGIYVKKVSNRVVVKVANVMEPGLFPAEPDETMTTPGIALILELPSHIPAPGAMEELIMTSRRISQGLNGRMYDMQRHLLRESDIQSMREAALDYESKKL